MQNHNGYISKPVSFSRKAVMASASVTRRRNTIHCITEVDITAVRAKMRQYFNETGEKLSLTAYVVTCLAQTLKSHPELNSFLKGNRHIQLQDCTISVMIERKAEGENVPEPLAIHKSWEKSFRQINDEIRAAQHLPPAPLGSLSGNSWFRFIPAFLLRSFISLADRNISMAMKYGKVAVTSVGMHGNQASWFIPHGSATVLITVGSIDKKKGSCDGKEQESEYLCITASFDHNIVDGAPSARFMKQFAETLSGGNLFITR